MDCSNIGWVFLLYYFLINGCFGVVALQQEGTEKYPKLIFSVFFLLGGPMLVLLVFLYSLGIDRISGGRH